MKRHWLVKSLLWLKVYLFKTILKNFIKDWQKQKTEKQEKLNDLQKAVNDAKSKVKFLVIFRFKIKKK